MPGFDRCLGIPEGPGVVLPELVGVADFETGVPGFSCCNTQVYTHVYMDRQASRGQRVCKSRGALTFNDDVSLRGLCGTPSFLTFSGSDSRGEASPLCADGDCEQKRRARVTVEG